MDRMPIFNVVKGLRTCPFLMGIGLDGTTSEGYLNSELHGRQRMRPTGDITTLLDLAPRDTQDNEYTPLSSEKTWWLPNQKNRTRPFSLSLQQFPVRGPAAFGQRFAFDLGSVTSGDLLFNTTLQIELGHWFDDTTLMRFDSGALHLENPYEGKYVQDIWLYANSLGSVILEKASLEIGDQVIEEVDGDFLNAASLLMMDPNNQYGVAVDGLGKHPLRPNQIDTLFPTQNRSIFVPIPFFFQRAKLQESLPLLACRDGTIRINITLRPFSECVRRVFGRRETYTDTPLNKALPLFRGELFTLEEIFVNTSSVIPQFKKVQLITYGANLDGIIRQNILRDPFESLIRVCNTFTFSEPLKYSTNKTPSDIIQVQLPLEVNDPIEEIIWFVRRKATQSNNEWTNYSAVTEIEYDPIYNPRRPLLHKAAIQLNGTEIINKEEQWFRQHIALAHKGGGAAYESFLYGYSFAKNPGEHQPSGTINASRLQSIRLTLDVVAPGGSYEQDWEVKAFVISLKWLRFQNGIANKMYQ